MHSDELVVLAHQVASDPERLARFIDAVSEIYDVSLGTEPHAPALAESGLAALKAIGSVTEQVDPIGAPDRHAASFTVDQWGIVAGLDAKASQPFPVRKGSSVYSVLADETSRAIVRGRLAGDPVHGQAGTSVVAIDAELSGRSFWLLHVLRDQGGAPAGRFTELKLGGSEQTCDALVEAFDLTATERELLLALVKGNSPRDFAELRGRSVETARTQVRSLLAKVGVSSQIDLIRLYAAAYSTLQVSADQPSIGSSPSRSGMLTLHLDDGRSLEVQTFGPPIGRPVLFLHNMFSGPFMTEAVITSLFDRNIRLICPWRAGFAGSTKLSPPPKDPVQATVDDIESVLNAMGVQKAPVIGCMSAAVYAVAATTMLPERISAALCVAGFPPIVNRSQIDTLQSWPRLFAYAARFVPGVLRLSVRAVVGLLLKGRASAIYDGLYRKTPIDLALVTDPANRASFIEDFAQAFRQGTGSYEIDAALAASDWSSFLSQNTGGTVRFLHGALDPVTPIAHLTAAVGHFPNVSITTAPKAGQLVMFEEVTLTMDTLEEMLASSAPR